MALTEDGARSLLVPQNRNPVLDQRMRRHIHLQKPNKQSNKSIQYTTDKFTKIQTLGSFPFILFFDRNQTEQKPIKPEAKPTKRNLKTSINRLINQLSNDR